MLKHIVIAVLIVIIALPVLVLRTGTAAAPGVVAEQWIIVDGPTGVVLAANDPDTPRGMASLTKVMTAIVAIERGHLDMPVTITQGDKVPESNAGLFVGTRPTLHTLLYALLLPSGNDAAMAIARAVGGSASFENSGARDQFVAWMNEKAAELGLANTHFTNPHGLDEQGHRSTPADLAALTRYALTLPEFREAFAAQDYRGDGYYFEQSNQLPEMIDGVVGGKTGWTDACGRCLIEVVSVGGREVTIVLLGSDLDWYEDAAQLAAYAASLPLPADSPDRASAVFDRLWERTDGLVAAGEIQRTWVWGEARGDVQGLNSLGSSTGKRYQRMFDKGRMEINHPYSQMDSGWYVTPSRLAAELVEGEAPIPVAGDLGAAGPLYADLTGVDWSAQTRGAPISRWLSSGGQFISWQVMQDYGVLAGSTSDVTGLATAAVFENYLGQTAMVLEAGEIVPGLLFDPPVQAVGHPITEPFWVTVPENGEFVDVLVQCFERRCLTYTPSHESEWQVEMSNIGLHYEIWEDLPANFANATKESDAIRRPSTPW